jgi:hypothetical protein
VAFKGERFVGASRAYSPECVEEEFSEVRRSIGKRARTIIPFLLLYEARKHKEGQGFLCTPALMIRLPVCLSSLRAAP